MLPAPPPTHHAVHAAASYVCRNAPRSVCITRRAGGRTIAVKVGWTVVVDLNGTDSDWSAPVTIGGRVLRQVGASTRHAGAVEVHYKAVAAGTTNLRATERPVCLPGRACPQFIVLWNVRVRVG